MLTMTRDAERAGLGKTASSARVVDDGELLLGYDEKLYIFGVVPGVARRRGARADLLAGRELPAELPSGSSRSARTTFARCRCALSTARSRRWIRRARRITQDMVALLDDLCSPATSSQRGGGATRALKKRRRTQRVAAEPARAARLGGGRLRGVREAALLLGDLDGRLKRLFERDLRADWPTVDRGPVSALAGVATPAALRVGTGAISGVRRAGGRAAPPGSPARAVVRQRNAAVLLGATRSAEACRRSRRSCAAAIRACCARRCAALGGIDDPPPPAPSRPCCAPPPASARPSSRRSLPSATRASCRCWRASSPKRSVRRRPRDRARRARGGRRARQRAGGAGGRGGHAEEEILRRAKARAFKTASVKALPHIGTAERRRSRTRRTGDGLLKAGASQDQGYGAKRTLPLRNWSAGSPPRCAPRSSTRRSHPLVQRSVQGLAAAGAHLTDAPSSSASSATTSWSTTRGWGSSRLAHRLRARPARPRDREDHVPSRRHADEIHAFLVELREPAPRSRSPTGWRRRASAGSSSASSRSTRTTGPGRHRGGAPGVQHGGRVGRDALGQAKAGDKPDPDDGAQDHRQPRATSSTRTARR